MQEFILNYYEIFLKIHFIGFIIGLGAATVSDYLFFRSIKDLKVTKSEYDTLMAVSKLVWVGIIIFSLSGATLFYGKMDYLKTASSFLAKVSIVSIVILNGFYLHSKVTPHLRKISFKDKITKQDHVLRLKTLIGGVISLTSWYSALFLAINKGYGYEYTQIMSFYFLVLGLGIASCFVIERNFHKIHKWKK